MDFIERLRLPYWLTYLLLFLVQSSIMFALAWVTGWLPAHGFDPILFLFPLWQWLPLAFMTYLDKVSIQALASFSPLLDIDESGLKRLKYEFSTMPSRGVILSGLLWGAFYLIIAYVYLDAYTELFGTGTILTLVAILEGLVAYLTGSAIYYHSVRQLRLVDRTVKMARQFNLFRLDPVYAFARLTSLTGISWMVLLTLTLLVFPIQLAMEATLGLLVLQLALAVAAFVLPLWFVHRRLEAGKRNLLAEFSQQVESTTAKLHRCLDENDLGPVTQLKDAMLGLSAEQAILNGIPTWPWRGGTLAGFLSVTLLPIILFIIQLGIASLLGE
jgi:hypothetical protein